MPGKNIPDAKAYKQLKVKKRTHRRLKKKAAESGMTATEFLDALIDFYENNHGGESDRRLDP